MQYLVLEPVVHIQLPYIYDSKFNDISINSFLFLITGKSWRLLTLKGSDCQSFLFLFYQPEATKLSFLGCLFFFRAPLFFKNSCEFLQLTSTVTFSGILFLSFFFCSIFLLPLQCLWAPEIFNFFPVFYSASVFSNFIFRWYVHCQHHVICCRNSWLVITRFVMIQLSIEKTNLLSSPWKMTFFGKFLWSQKFSSNAGALPLNNVALQLWC